MIGYLAVDLFEPLGYVGGCLVVDEHGLPLEFRHTLPVRPTKLQRALYGAAIDRYLRTVVIAQRVLDTLEHQPPLVLVSEQLLLLPGEPPCAYVTDAGVAPVGRVGDVEAITGASPGFLLQVRADEAPLRVLTEAPAHVYPELGKALAHAAETMDVLEPMARVRASIGLIAAGDVAA